VMIRLQLRRASGRRFDESSSESSELALRINVFQGHFLHGKRHGRGGWLFHDGSSLQGDWRDDNLHGHGSYTFPDGRFVEGSYVGGALHGRVREFTASAALFFDGYYENNLRHGSGKLFLPDGGVYEGEWVRGEFTSDNNRYVYPPALTVVCSLRGRWFRGRMISARFYYGEEARGNRTFSSDPATFKRISRDPLLADPFEQLCCFVHRSSLNASAHSAGAGTHPMDDAGEGLFAKVDLPAGVVVSFYNGLRQRGSRTERNPWRLNTNAIALDEEKDIDIDVPPSCSDPAVYCASLGHKANHSFEPVRRTAKYDVCYHPRFGLIKCIRTVVAVRAGEELLVDYGYKIGPNSGPAWFRRGYRNWRAHLNVPTFGSIKKKKP